MNFCNLNIYFEIENKVNVRLETQIKIFIN